MTAEIARTGPSSAWVLAISYGAQHVAAAFGDRVREELCRDDPL
ncbi:hypothetical protein [Kutzneria albida]|nr:hypothetical protein [Kutzneria albida]